MKWHATDGNAEIEIEANSGLDAAREYVKGGDWGERDKTQSVTVYVWQLDDAGERIEEERHKIALEPIEPGCTGEEHDWQSPLSLVGGIKENPGVYGHGGGVTIHEVCMRCGCGKLIDTWAQDPEDGEQGLRSVEYRPDEFAEQVEAMRMAEVREYVESHSDEDTLDPEELERMFVLAYGRTPDDDDRHNGLWSLICAMV